MTTALARSDAPSAPAAEIIYPAQPQPLAHPQQAADDHELINLWLYGRPAQTVRAYRRDVAALMAWSGRGVRAWTLGDLQGFAEHISTGRSPSSVARTMSAIKSLLTQAHRLGYVAINVGAALILPKLENRRGERIVSEAAIHRLFALAPDGRDGLILRLFYYAGLRCDELARLRWRHVQQGAGGCLQLQVLGKGRKTRYVLLGGDLTAALHAWQAAHDTPPSPDEPLFRAERGRNTGGALSTSQLWRIVKQAAVAAGLPADFSPHWLRHAHASHALDRGAPISLVQQTLGHASVQTTGKYLHARPDDSSGRYLA